MKSMFSMGFFSNDVFSGRDAFLGASAADGNAYLSALNAALAQYQQVITWASQYPSWQSILGSEASNFQDLYAMAQKELPKAQSQQSLLSADPTTFDPSSADKATADAFISDANTMLEIITRHPIPMGTVPISNPGTPPGGPLPGTPAAAASSLQTPLLIAGGFLVAAVAIVLLRPS